MNRAATPTPLHFYTTPPHGCSYLPGRQAVTLFADPGMPKNDTVYALLSGHGFRRSGEHLYRPHCHACRACVAVRLSVQEFIPRRHQRRAWEMNADLEVLATPPAYRSEHFELYRQYLAGRHPGGGMDHPNPQQYLEFLTSSWTTTLFYEMRLRGRLVAVAVVDQLGDALSAVYTFYDPQLQERSLGKFAVLYEIETARTHGLRWLYLGYWIAACRKMNYKIDFQPLEYFWEGSWTRRAPAMQPG
ncbi:MAG: arginyltransferase [Chromatiales bacterium]